jgi:hypothetical protein
LLVAGLKNDATGCYLLADKEKKPLATQAGKDGLAISLPLEAPDPISSTVVLEIKGAPNVDQTALLINQDYDGSISLPASEARLHGEGVQTESSAGHDSIGYWTNPGDWADWEFKVATPGKFAVSVDVATPDATSLDLTAGESHLRADVKTTGSYGKFKTVKFGAIEIAAAGTVTLAMHPVAEGWHPVNVRSLRLTPVGSQSN